MRLGRLVAAGLLLGVVAGFFGALLRPRPYPGRGIGHRTPAPHSGDLAAARRLATAAGRSSTDDLGTGAATGREAGATTDEPAPRRPRGSARHRLDVDAVAATDPAASAVAAAAVTVGSRSRGANG